MVSSIILNAAQDSQIAELPSSQIFDLSLGCVLFGNTAAACHIAAYELSAGSEGFSAAVTLTLPTDHAFAIPKAGDLYDS